MGIKIELSYLQPFINGAKAVEVNGSTVGECLEHLVDKFPKLKLFDKDGKSDRCGRAFYITYVCWGMRRCFLTASGQRLSGIQA